MRTLDSLVHLIDQASTGRLPFKGAHREKPEKA